MLALFWWIIIGLLAGLLARLIMPGPQPLGWLLTIGLGLAGSFVGGFLSSLLFRTDPTEPGFHASGLIMSTIGAVILLVIYGSIQKRRITP